LKYTSTNVVYAAGDFGSIIKSTNAGLNWTCIYNDYLVEFTSLFFVNDNYGFVVGGYNPLNFLFDTNFIIKTVNGGLSWERLNTGVLGRIDGIYFSDIDTGYINVNIEAAPPGKILKTIDGGMNWTQLNHGANGYIRSMNFLNANTGFALCDSGFIKTSDGGVNWMQNHLDTASGFPVMLFIDENTGFIAGTYAGVRKTTNGGLNWTNSGGSNWSNSISSLNFINAFTGYAAGGYNYMTGAIYATTNSGLNWILQLSGFPGFLWTVHFSNANTGVATGDYGHLYATSNGGVNWSDQSEGIRNGMTNLYFINSNTGFAAGYWGITIKTTDGGGNWISKNFDTITVPSALWFTNAQTGFIGGQDYGTNYARLYRTSNGGNNWYLMLNQYFGSCNSIYFLDNFTGYCTWGSDIYKTLNSGINWYSKYPEGTLQLNSVCFSGPIIGYAVGNQGIFIKTTNGGENWLTMPSWTSTNITLTRVLFKDINTGYATGYYNLPGAAYFYKTTNGGINWTTIIPWPGNYNFYSSMSFINVNTGYLISQFILKTTNGGNNWFSQNPRAGNIRYIFAVDDSIAYACGDNGTILKTTNGGGYLSKVERISYSIPEKYSLLQNYPNPFNPSTKIKFSIPLSRGVPRSTSGRGVLAKLSIYDLLGREVTILVNQQLQPGTYEVEWDGTNYPSGVYFYRMTAGAFSESKRMVLVK
jgi:photosystem II stability/assembly factor-like uncharacterized protein